MKRRAVAQLKGGVGKSTSTMFIAEHWALKGKRVLVIDLDPQASVSYMLLSAGGVDEAEAMHRTLPQLVADVRRGDPRPAHTYLIPRASNLRELQKPSPGLVAILPCVPRLWFTHFEFERACHERREDPTDAISILIEKFLGELQDEYDCVLFDCPPGFNSLTRAAIRLAPERIIAPTLADEVSIKSLVDFATLGLAAQLNIRWQDQMDVVVSRFSGTNQQKSNLDALRRGYNVVDPPIRMLDQALAASVHLKGAHKSYAEKYGGPLFRPLSSDVRRMTDVLFRATFG
jgi:chromosome partitioning protein